MRPGFDSRWRNILNVFRDFSRNEYILVAQKVSLGPPLQLSRDTFGASRRFSRAKSLLKYIVMILGREFLTLLGLSEIKNFFFTAAPYAGHPNFLGYQEAKKRSQKRKIERRVYLLNSFSIFILFLLFLL